MKFTKSPLTIEQQICLLKDRGMAIEDEALAAHYLKHINYYRLCAYWLPFEQDHANHHFRDGTSFQAVLNLYISTGNCVFWCLMPSNGWKSLYARNGLTTFPISMGRMAILNTNISSKTAMAGVTENSSSVLPRKPLTAKRTSSCICFGSMKKICRPCGPL